MTGARRRARERGEAPLFLLVAFLLACGTGVAVYLYLKDHYAQAKVAEARATPTYPAAQPDPVRPSPAEAAVPGPTIEPIPAARPPDPPAIPDEPPAEEVKLTLDAARGRFADCGEESVMVTLKIRPSGRVEQVTVGGTTSDEVQACITTVAKRIRFAKSAKGVTVRYPLLLGLE